jgi:putative transposase
LFCQPCLEVQHLRNTAKALQRFVHRSHTAIRDWIQKYKPIKRLVCRKANVAEFIIDEIQLKVGSEIIWLWVAIEPKNREILSISISNKTRNMFVAERFYHML